MSNIYNSYFFNEFYQENGGGNYTDSKFWTPFFEMIAERIVDIFNPKKVLDTGCACGYLVAALRDKGVEAYGIDISDYAIEKAREDIRPYLNVQSITENLPKKFPAKYDLVVTIEVLEHLFPEEGRKAIELLCSYSDTVIFTSTPTDIEDKTHVNVQQKEYWAKIFAEQSFYRDLYQPVDFICGWAMLFRKRDDISKVIFEYELSDRVEAIKKEEEKKEKFKCYYRLEGQEFFSEEFSTEKHYAITEERIEIEINQNKVITALRIDPMECNCIIKHFHVYDLLNDREELSVRSMNGMISHSRIIFSSSDPMIEIEVPQNNGTVHLEVTFEVEHLDSSLISDTYHMLAGERKQADKLRKEKMVCQQETEASVMELQEKYVVLQQEKLFAEQQMEKLKKEQEEEMGVITEELIKKLEGYQDAEQKIRETYEEGIRRLTAKCAELEQEKKEIQAVQVDYLKEKEVLASKLEELIRQKNELEEKYKDEQKNNVKERDSLRGKLERSYEAKREKVEKLQDEKAEISRENEVLKLRLEAVGNECSSLREQLDSSKKKIKALLKVLRNKEEFLASELAACEDVLEQKDLQILRERNERELQEQKIIDFEKASQEEVLLLQSEYAEKENRLISRLMEQESRNQQVTSDNQQLRACLEVANAEKDAYVNSTCWKITAPIRKTSDVAKRIKNSGIKGVQWVFRGIKRRVTNDIGLQASIDTLSYEGDILVAGGWIFSSKKEIQDLRIVIKSQNNSFCVEEGYKNIKRDDVYNVFGNENAMTSGFEFKCYVHALRKFAVYLEYMVDSKYRNMLLGEFTRDVADGEEENVYAIAECQNVKDVLEKYVMNNDVDYSEVYKQEYDIIVPIYNGYKYFAKLFSTLEKTKAKYRLILVNDCSPDKNVDKFLNEYCKKHKNVVLIKHETNMGFVRSVNDGLAKAKNNVVILNTDVELPASWLERLMLPLIKDSKVATATPFTNSGTICSFPKFLEDNKLFAVADVSLIDKAFSKVKPHYVSAPTGVGFCMAMSKAAIEEVGYLDYETFSKGYGEENDWCQRAIKAGFKNVIVENLFVFHNHGGSFPSEEKKRLLERNGELLSMKHPEYNRDVATYCSLNPHEDLRKLLICMLASKLSNKSYMIFNHAIGGGATKYLDNFVFERIQNEDAITVLEYDIKKNLYNIKFFYLDFQFTYYCNTLEYFLDLCKYMSFDEIIINELVTYPELYVMMKTILEIRDVTKAKLVHLLHDYFPICPTINLLNDEGKHCYLDCTVEMCDKCLSKNKSIAYSDYVAMEEWRNNWGDFLKKCDEVIVFSNSSRELLEKTFGNQINVIVRPHKVDYMPNINKKYKTTESFNIGLLGILCQHKGSNVIKDLLKKIKVNNLNIKVVLIGTCTEDIEDENLIITGAYTYDELPILSLKYDIDMFLISSIWPETFSYTAEEAMKMGYEVACFDLGAPAERIKNYEKGHVLKEMTAEEILKVVSEISLCPLVNQDKRILFLTDYFSFSSRYRVEHLMEQLIINGIVSDFISTAEISNVEIDRYSTVVFYRSKWTEEIETFIGKVKSKKIPVYYDVDDLVFDYKKISYLEFLKKDEYVNFEEETKLTKKCMDLCDGFITSTNHLKAEIEDSCPGKPVCVNRNVASLEMLTISNKVKEGVAKDNNRVVLGYFSGSRTHDKDFALIEDTILKIMEENENVYLKIGGVLELSEEFNKFGNRILRHGFCDWKHLPEVIASVDINLMPVENTIFHKCKSENKWTEAALVNVCTVASYNEELACAIKNAKNGFLCKDSEEWYRVLSKLVKDQKLRREISRKANKDVIEQSTVLTVKDSVLKFLQKELESK